MGSKVAESVEITYVGKKMTRGSDYFSLDLDKAKLVNDPKLENRPEY